MPRLKTALYLTAALFAAPQAWSLQGESIYIKGTLGGVYTIASETVNDITFSLSGVGGVSHLYVGGSLNKSFKVFGYTGIALTPKPTLKVENLSIGTVHNAQTIFDLGIGAAFYTRGGQYVSLGASIAQNYYNFNVYGVDVGTYTRHGWGSQLMLGQEFPISGRLSLGVSGLVYYGQVADVGPAPFDSIPISNFYAGLVVGITYD